MAKMKANFTKSPRKSILTLRRELSKVLMSASPEVRRLILIEKVTNAIVTAKTRRLESTRVHFEVSFIDEGLPSLEDYYYLKRVIVNNGGWVGKKPLIPRKIGSMDLVEVVMEVGGILDAAGLNVTNMHRLLRHVRSVIRENPQALKLKKRLNKVRTG